MNKLSLLKNVSLTTPEDELILEKKNHQLSFKTFYLSKEKPPSPYKMKDNKEFKEKFKYFNRLNKKFQNLFAPKDKFLAEKKKFVMLL